MDVYSYPHGDSLLIDKIVNEFLSQGKFDKLRKECMSDADTKPAYQNLQQRVENTVTQFLKKQVWKPDLNKNQLRDSLRKHILESKFFDAGINRIVDQVVNPNVLATVFLPEVEEVVYNYLSIPRPSEKSQKNGSYDETSRTPKKDFPMSFQQERIEKYEKEKSNGNGKDQRRENEVKNKSDELNDVIKAEPVDVKGKTEIKVEVKSEVEEDAAGLPPTEKMEVVTDDSQESLSRMTDEGLRINEPKQAPPPDSDDSVPLEVNEKSMSESRDSEDSIMNQMSPISQGRLTPDLEELPEIKPEIKEAEKPEEKNPLTFIGRIPKIKREDSDSSKLSRSKEETAKKEKMDVKTIYSSDESDSSKSNGKSDKKNERRRDEEKKEKEKKDSSKDRSREREHRRERSRERHKKSSSSSSSAQRERNSSHHKSSHRHKDSRSKRKEEEKRKSKNTDDHAKERNKKEDRRSTDRDSNERERGRSSGNRGENESKKKDKEPAKTEESRTGKNQKEEAVEVEKAHTIKEAGGSEKTPASETLKFPELIRSGAVTRHLFPKLTDDFYVKFNSTGFRYFEEWEKTKLDCEEEFKEFVDEAEKDVSLLSTDEDSDEETKAFAEENARTIRNLWKGVGNFKRSLMFDPVTSQFYAWTNLKSYLKHQGVEEGKKTETIVESIKENIERGEKRRAMHLKLLKKYKRKAMRLGKPRRKQKRPEFGGIKEKNENLKNYNGVREEGLNVGGDRGGREGIPMPESPEENEEWKKGKEKMEGTKLTPDLPLNLPPSPDSDDVNTNCGVKIQTVDSVSRKRADKSERAERDAGTPKKPKRSYSNQKYESQDLYKPRPILNGSRTRGKERGCDSPISR